MENWILIHNDIVSDYVGPFTSEKEAQDYADKKGWKLGVTITPLTTPK